MSFDPSTAVLLEEDAPAFDPSSAVPLEEFDASSAMLVEDAPALPGATPSPVPQPDEAVDFLRDAERNGQAADDQGIKEGIFPAGSTPWKTLDGRLYIDPARYNMAVEQMWKLGVIDSTNYTELLKGTVDQWDEASQTYIPSVEKATAARRDLERRAGAFPEAKAAASGLLKGAMQTGAALVAGPAAAAATIPTGPGAVVMGIAGGAGAAIATGAAYDKALEASAKESDLLDSFYAANQLAPGYNSAGQLVSILAPTPVSVSRLANAANLIRAEKGGAEAAKFLSGALGTGAAIGVGTDVAIQAANIGLDKLIHPEINPLLAAEQYRQTGEQPRQRPEFDPASTAISGTLGALTAGIGVKARNKTYAPEELVTLENQVRTGRASRQEADDYNVMRQAVEALRSDERLIDAQAIRRATVDAAGFRFLDTTEIINPRFQQAALADAGFTPRPAPPAIPYAAENPVAAIPIQGQPAAYTGQAFLNRGGAAPAFQGGSNALPGPEGIPALPAPAAPVVSNDTFDPSTATEIPPTASISVDQIPLQNYIFERRKAAALEFNVSDKELDENGFSEKELKAEYQSAFLKSVEGGAKPNAAALNSLPVEKVVYLQKFHRDQLPAGYQHPDQIAGMKSAGIRFTPKRGEVRPVSSTIPPEASARVASATIAPEVTGSPEVIAGEGALPSTPPTKPSPKLQAAAATPEPVRQSRPVDPSVMRDQKKFLVSEIDRLIQEAPDITLAETIKQARPDLVAQYTDIESQIAKLPLVGDAAGALVAEQRKELQARLKSLDQELLAAAPKVTIEVPGDGVFTIHNTKQTLTDFAAKAKNFPSTVSRPAEPAKPASNPSQIPAVASKPEDWIKAVASFAHKEGDRGSIDHIWQNSEVTVATDGRMLMIARNGGKPPAKVQGVRLGSSIDEGWVLSPKTLKPVSKESILTYPDWRQVLPAQDANIPLAEVDAGQLLVPVNQARSVLSSEADENSRVIELVVNPDSTIGVAAKAPASIGEGDEFNHNVQPGAKPIGRYQADRLRAVIGGMRSTGQSMFRIHGTSTESEMNPLVVENGNSFGVLMPMRSASQVPVSAATKHLPVSIRDKSKIFWPSITPASPAKKSKSSGSKSKADAGPPTPVIPAGATIPKPQLNTYNDAQVFADYPDAVGVVRSSKGGWTMPLILGGTDKVPAIEMPELVEMVRSLTGNTPAIRKLPKAYGTFAPGTGEITLRPDLFQDEASAMLTFAHEIGHLVSWMDERNIKLGNLGGHIMNVGNFLKSTFPVDGKGEIITPKERRELYSQARNSMPQGSKPEKDDPGRGDWEMEVASRYRELIQELMDERGLGYVGSRRGDFDAGAYNPNVREELIGLSEWWKPFDYDAAPDSYIKYRHSAAELYADAISVLFNSPADLQQRAPVFWKAFWNYADARPQVKASIFEIQNRILNGRDAVLDKRLARDMASFKAGAEVFIGKQAAAAARRASLTGWWDNLKDQYWNKYQPLIEAAAKARAAGKITRAEEDAYRWLTEEHPLAESKLQVKLADIGRLYQSLDAAGVPRHYFGLWLKYHRIANERLDVMQEIDGQMQIVGETGRAVMANPGGETARTATEMLGKLRTTLGPDKSAALETAVAGFREVVFSIMEDANAAGLFSQELWQTISSNKDNYAAFTPLEYVQEYLPSAIRKQVGTFKEIADPLQQTVLKVISIHRAAQNNKFKRAAVAAIRQTAPELITPAPMKYNGKAMIPQPPQITGLQLVQWKEDGQLTGVHLPDRYARMWEDKAPAERDAILRLLSTGFQRLVYGAIIRYNPAFQLFMSPARDLQRSLTNMPGGVKGRARFLMRLLDPETWGASLDWARGDVGRTQLMREMIENAAAGGPHSAFGGRMGSADDSLDAILRKFHLQDQKARNVFVRAIMAPLKGIEFAGQILQMLPKASAYKVLVKDMGVPAPQAANTIRNHIGIPNYYKKGRHAQAAGAIVPFLNIFLRSYDSLQRNLRGAERNMSGKEWWLAWLLTGGGLIAVMQTLAKEGIFGQDLEKLYSRVPNWDMTNFAVLPLGNVPTGDTGGKTAYLRLPQDEGMRVINGVVGKVISSAIRSAKGDPTAPQLGDVFGGISSQVPGANTLVELGTGWTTFLAGRNPRDEFRNRNILSEDQWLAGGWDATKPMLGWTLGVTGITNFFSYDTEADTFTELAISSTPVVNKFLKITDRGVYQNQTQLKQADERDMAKVRLSLPKFVDGLRTEYNYLKTRGNLRSERENDRYLQLGAWHRTYRQTMDEIETGMELGQRPSSRAALDMLTRESEYYRQR